MYPFYLYFVLLAAICWLFIKKRNNSKALRLFAHFIIYSLIIENLAFFYSLTLRTSNHWIYNVLTVFQVIWLGVVYITVINNKTTQKIIRVLITLYPVLVIINFLTFQPFTGFHTYTYIIGCFMVFYFSIQYLKDFLNQDTLIPLRRQPFFWISISNIIFYTTSIFYMGSINYILLKNLDEYGELINLFVYFFASVQYCLYATGLLCNLKLKVN